MVLIVANVLALFWLKPGLTGKTSDRVASLLVAAVWNVLLIATGLLATAVGAGKLAWWHRVSSAGLAQWLGPSVF